MFSFTRWLRRASVCGIAAGTFFQPSWVSAQVGTTLPAQSIVTTPVATDAGKKVTPGTFTGVTEPLVGGAKKTEPEAIPAPTKGETIIVQAEEPKNGWLTTPNVRPGQPRLGHFIVPPKGCGYYSGIDWLQGNAREAAPKYGYPPFGFYTPGFFDTDWRYVDQPGATPDLFEKLHRVHLGDDWMFGTGGQAWWRHMREVNSRLSGNNNTYDLFRARAYGDLWYRDMFRVYAEFITAHNIGPDLPPLRIDENRADLLNLFVDVKLGELNCKPVYARIGRQELNLGSTRLLSTLDWANTRRTFEGARLTYTSEKLDADAFFVRPVLVDSTKFDKADNNQNFAGAWMTYRPVKGQSIDAYYLYLDNHNNVTTGGIAQAPTVTNTFGARYVGDKDGFLWDIEGGFQFGTRGAANLAAGFATAGVGYNFAKAPMNPTVWAYYDWASGDSSRNAGNFNTFNQQQPFGHYYMGFLDVVGRQNIRDISGHLYLHPAKWITFNAQYHFFSLDKGTDALYGPAGNVLRSSANASAGGIVGQEIDLLVNFHLTKSSDFILGYSRMQAGEFLRNTGNGTDPELFYAMYSFRW